MSHFDVDFSFGGDKNVSMQKKPCDFFYFCVIETFGLVPKKSISLMPCPSCYYYDHDTFTRFMYHLNSSYLPLHIPITS